jgi:hypothetical protein
VHPEAWQWLDARIRPRLAAARRVLDLGGRDVNGSPRALFSFATDYMVLDTEPGPDVDVVADAATWQPPRELRGAFDVTLCTEVFEHAPRWRAIVYNLWLTLARGGTCLVTCATHPRPPHSRTGAVPLPAGEWYANVAPEELLPVMRALFRAVEQAGHPRGDLYVTARR